MGNALQRGLLQREIQELKDGAVFLWTMRAKAAQAVGNKEKAAMCEKELAEALGSIAFYEEELKKLTQEAGNA